MSVGLLELPKATELSQCSVGSFSSKVSYYGKYCGSRAGDIRDDERGAIEIAERLLAQLQKDHT